MPPSELFERFPSLPILTNALTTKVFDLVQALGEATIDEKMAMGMGEKARRREILGGNGSHVPSKAQLVGSSVLEQLYSSADFLRSSSGISHVLYAPSSVGKTTALLYFMKNYLEKYQAPAIMISGQFPGEVDYLACMAAALQIPSKESTPCNTWWVKSLVSGLLPKETERLQHAPVLILDEFNSLGDEKANVLFAESLSRYVYEKGLTVIFVTQNEVVAREICASVMLGRRLVLIQV